MLSARPSRRKSSAIGFRRAGYLEQCGSSLRPNIGFRVARRMSRTSWGISFTGRSHACVFEVRVRSADLTGTSWPQT